MGISSDGILFYGIMFDWEDGNEPWADDEGGDEAWVCDKLGISDKEPKHDDYKSQDWKDYWEYKRERLADIGIEFVLHCAYDYAMWGLAISPTILRAYRGYPKEIDSIDIAEEWNEKLRAFCELVGVPYSEPKWWLCSVYG